MSGSWTATVDTAALAVTGLGVGLAAFVLGRTRTPGAALAVLMEVLTAAGLLRLAAAPTVTRALAAAGVVVVRRLAVLGIRGGDPVAGVIRHLRTLSGPRAVDGRSRSRGSCWPGRR